MAARGCNAVLLLAGATALVLAAADLGRAATYYYVDAEGVYHFTNAPTKPWFRIVPGFGLPEGANLTVGPYADLIHRTARAHGIDPDLVKAVIRVESNFDARAVSRKGAQGLMQLMPTTAAEHAVGDAFDPAQNIDGGVRYLRRLLDLFNGDLRLALAGYNAGENAVWRYGGLPPYRETQQYVRRVLAMYRSRDFGDPANGRKSGALSPAGHQAAQPEENPRPVYLTRDREGRLLYTNAPR